MKTAIQIAVFALVLLAAGFASAAENQAVPASDPALQENVCRGQAISTDALEASLSPIYIVLNHSRQEKVAFLLKITNKTDQDMALDWNNTFFIDRGQANGGFAFETQPSKKSNVSGGAGVVSARSSTATTTIPAGGTVSRKIWPMALTYYAGPSLGWFRVPIPAGENEGIYLAIKMGGRQDEKERFALDLCELAGNKG